MERRNLRQLSMTEVGSASDGPIPPTKLFRGRVMEVVEGFARYGNASLLEELHETARSHSEYLYQQ